MADNIGVYDISGQLQRVATSSLGVVHSGLSASINERRSTQRTNYNRLLKGAATKVQAAQSPFDATPADPPSWTQFYAGKKHAFLISELSSSQHEVTSLNARISGTAKLENTAVPASGTLLYSKQTQLVKRIYKLTAFSASSMGPAAERLPSTIENLARYQSFVEISGTYRNNSYWNPATFEIDVPDYGKIRDIKVWVELIHDHRGGPGTGSADASNAFWAGGSGSALTDLRHGLQGLQIALRSPNTNFKNAHPLWNDPTVSDLEKMPSSIGTGTLAQTHRNVPELLRNSYLLWAGHTVERDLGITLGALTSSTPSSYFLETVATGTAGNVLGAPSFALDMSGFPFYSYIQENKIKIRVPQNVGSSSPVYTVVSGGTVDSNAAFNDCVIRLDSKLLRPTVMYIDMPDGSSETLRVLQSSSSGLSMETCYSGTNGSAIDFDFAIDKNDKVAAIFMTDQDYAHSIIMSSSTGWQRSLLNPSSQGNLRGATGARAIRSDSTSKFHFISLYTVPDGQRTDLFYGTTGSSGLTLSSVGIPACTWASLALNSRDEPVIAFSHNIDTGLGIATLSGTTWSTKNYFKDQFMSGVALSRDSVAFDSNDNLYVLGHSSLRYRDQIIPYDLIMFVSRSNGMSFEVVRDRTLGTSSKKFELATSRNVMHVLHNDSVAYGLGSASGTFFHLSKSFDTNIEASYHEFDTDIDMRTIFTDSSQYKNPRSLAGTHAIASVNALSNGTLHIDRILDETQYASPLSSSVSMFGLSYLDPQLYKSSWLTGANFPWMLDSRIPPGNFKNRAGIPVRDVPAGWLTGPGQSAGTDEFPTSGSQIGPPTIRAVYPLLDDVFVQKMYFQQPISSSISGLPSSRKIVGFRPGLRNTEVHGKWKLMIGNTADYNATGSPPAISGSERGGFWFRQLRLEFTLDQGAGISETSFASRSKKKSQGSYVATREGVRVIDVLSGSSSWDIGTNIVYVEQQQTYGRSVGITSDKADSTYAVYSKITGSFAAILSGSGKLSSVESSYLSNEFGTPYIPLSSGSGEPPSSDTYDQDEFKNTKRVFDAVFGRNTLISSDNTLRAHITRDDVFKSSRDLAADAVNASMSSSNP